MTAHDLITDIFSRHQDGVPGHMRRITRPQLDFLLGLIGEDEEGGAVENVPADAGFRATAWKPSGRNKYIVTEDLRGKRHTLTRLSNLVASGTGCLF
jgi:hypothetical protein